MSDDALPGRDDDPGERTEHRWAAVAASIMVLLIAVAVFAGITMVSNVPFWSFKEVNWKKRVPLWVILVCVIAISVIASRPSLVLWALFMSYALSGYIMWAMGHRVRPVLPEDVAILTNCYRCAAAAAPARRRTVYSGGQRGKTPMDDAAPISEADRVKIGRTNAIKLFKLDLS